MADSQYKRVMIITPNNTTQKYLSKVTLENFEAYFETCRWPVEIQPFESIGQTYEMHSEIGKGGEILVLFDDLLTRSGSNLKALLLAAEKNCDALGTPFLVYQKNSGSFHDLMWFVKKDGGRDHEYTGVYESSSGLSHVFKERVLACLRDERVFQPPKVR